MFSTICRNGSRVFGLRQSPYYVRMVQTHNRNPTETQDGKTITIILCMHALTLSGWGTKQIRYLYDVLVR